MSALLDDALKMLLSCAIQQEDFRNILRFFLQRKSNFEIPNLHIKSHPQATVRMLLLDKRVSAVLLCAACERLAAGRRACAPHTPLRARPPPSSLSSLSSFGDDTAVAVASVGVRLTRRKRLRDSLRFEQPTLEHPWDIFLVLI